MRKGEKNIFFVRKFFYSQAETADGSTFHSRFQTSLSEKINWKNVKKKKWILKASHDPQSQTNILLQK